MNWVTIIWSMIVSACLTMAVIHLLVWGLQRQAWASLLFGLASVATAVFAAIELWMMRTTTTVEYGVAVRWLHVPTWVLLVSLAGFVRVYLGAGRIWLLSTLVALRSLALAVNFLQPVNLNYREITSLRHVVFLGESVAVPVGVVNPWMILGQFSLLLFVIYVVDATVTVWRRGNRRLALVVGGSITFFMLAGMVQSLLVAIGVLYWPVSASCFFILVIAAISFEMSLNVLRAGQLAAELQESQKQVVLASTAARIGLWTRDHKSNTIRATREWRAMFGFSPSEPVDFDRFIQKVHPDDRARLGSAVAAALAGDGDYNLEYRLALTDGKVRWISSRGRWETNPQTQSLVLRGVSMDVTELKLAEEKFRLVVEASPQGVVLTDVRGQMVLVNDQTDKMFGYAREELIGQPIDLLMPERFRARHAEKMQAYLGAPQVRALGVGREFVGCRKDGTEFPVEIGMSLIQNTDSTLVLTVIADITARKLAETEAIRQRAELTHFARVSTMGALAGSLAHELNQPLSAILNNAQAATRFLAAAPPDLAEVRGALDDIAQDTKRAGEVIRQIRNLVRREEPNRQPLEINRVITDVVRLLHNDTMQRKIRITLDLGPSPIHIRGDSVQLQQVVLNVMLNAFDAMKEAPEERRKVTLRATRRDPGSVQVAVQDGGTGISPERLRNLFEPFRSSKKDGLGLGLSICQTIVTAHEGQIWAENNTGTGATVYFTLPRLDGTE